MHSSNLIKDFGKDYHFKTTPLQSYTSMVDEEDCKCIRIDGHLEAVNWRQWPRHYKPSPGFLSLGDWTRDPFIWPHYEESCDGALSEDEVLKTTDTRFWSIDDVQRYFVGDLHCEKVLFTYQYPNLRMPTPLGSHLWKTHVSLKRPSQTYQRELYRSLEVTLKKMEMEQSQMDRLIVNDQLFRLDRLDYFKRKTFFRILLNLLQIQDRLQLVSFENLCCERLEGVRLIQQLACFNADTLKYLFLWRFVKSDQNPLLINYSYITGSGKYIPRPTTKHCFIRSLASLRTLKVLALEYSHLADGTGSSLISLIPVMNKPHFILQLICREDQIPGRVDPSMGTGGYEIPDTAWKRIAISCPNIYLQMVFYRVRDYDNVRRFLSPSVPLRDARLQYGIDLKTEQRQDSDLHCFIRHVAYFYKSTLVSLSVHQWRFAVFPLCRVLELLPDLVRFHYVGRVQDEVDLKRLLTIIACGACEKLKSVRIQIQDEVNKREYWNKVVESLNNEFEEIAKLFDLNLCISIYKI